MPGLSLYIHIPFCNVKCPYCDFAVSKFRADSAERYVKALSKEIKQRSKILGVDGRTVETLYIGGGTPALLTIPQVAGIFDELRRNFIWNPETEVSIEANPNTIDETKLRDLKSLGINRLSIGVQSFDDDELKVIGRDHTSAQVVEAFEEARNAGYTNINIDLIFGIPGKTLEAWEKNLSAVVDMQPEHISTYCLTIEPKTLFDKLFRMGKLQPVSEEEQAQLYEKTIEVLTSSGYCHYEISNFAFPTYECQHNLHYWDHHSDYLGFGTSAHSFLYGKRFWNTRATLKYIDLIEQVGSAMEMEEELSRKELLEEEIFLGLRQTKGLDLKFLKANFEDSMQGLSKDSIKRMIEGGFLVSEADVLKLTCRGLLLADAICSELISKT